MPHYNGTEVRSYHTVDADGVRDGYRHDTLQEAIDAAGEGEAVVALVYEYTDEELVWTPDGSGVWPNEPD